MTKTMKIKGGKYGRGGDGHQPSEEEMRIAREAFAAKNLIKLERQKEIGKILIKAQIEFDLNNNELAALHPHLSNDIVSSLRNGSGSWISFVHVVDAMPFNMREWFLARVFPR